MSHRRSDGTRLVRAGLEEARRALDDLLRDETTLDTIARCAGTIVDAFRAGGKVMACGNGGSMCDAAHFIEELTGRYRLDRAPLPALAINDAAHISCVANDFGYEQVFSRYVEAHGRAGDVLIAISTSGRSPTVIAAARVARAQGVTVVALTGRADSALMAEADICICTPGGRFADRVQELHIKVLHILIELIEREMFPANYTEPPVASV